MGQKILTTDTTITSEGQHEGMAVFPSAHAHAMVLEGESIVLNLESGRYYTLNNTGTMLWVQLSKGCSTDSLLQSLRASGKISEKRAKQDLTVFLGNLASEGLINKKGGSTNGKRSQQSKDNCFLG